MDDYSSEAFGYRFRARASGWFSWDDLATANDGADFGALSAKGYGAVVMPMCWLGPRPTANALYRVMMQQFGEDYPSAFISHESTMPRQAMKTVMAASKQGKWRRTADGKVEVGGHVLEPDEFTLRLQPKEGIASASKGVLKTGVNIVDYGLSALLGKKSKEPKEPEDPKEPGKT